jgi:ferrous iron transport protein B
MNERVPDSLNRSSPPETSTAAIALIGNPNTGKSTLFAALSGVRQRTGNYPGVTVERKEGQLQLGDEAVTLIDLPGTYSLAPRSPDEMIAVDVLLGRQAGAPVPDIVLCIVDASNLERNLYLVNQVLELGRPTVVALNMIDLAESKGLRLDVARLERQLGLPVIPIQAHRKQGLERLLGVLQSACQAARKSRSVGAVGAATVAGRASPFPESFQREVAALSQIVAAAGESAQLPRYLIERLLLDTTGYLAKASLPGVTPQLLAAIPPARQRLADSGLAVPGVEAIARYGWVAEVLTDVVTRPAQRPVSFGDKLDRVLTHRVAGTIIFVLLMTLMFQSVYWVAEPAKLLLDWLKGGLSEWVENTIAPGPLQSLLVNGVIEGVGGVLVFLPQIFTLFFFIAILEDCGYMARAAYLMDRLMSRVGLSGRSFIPLLSSFACAIPGIMSARVIENPRDRLVTILVAPLMSCSARLPVYLLMINAFFPDQRYLGGVITLRALLILAMYALGIVVAILVALLLKRTILHGVTPPFVMELPSYKIPGIGIVLHRMLDRGWAFIQRAGTLILAVSILVWAAAYFPRSPQALDPAVVERPEKLALELAQLQQQLAEAPTTAAERAELESQLAAIQLAEQAARNRLEGAYLQASYLGQLGTRLEPLVRPLGWDWRIGCAALASFPAREVVVATLGVIYNLGTETDAESESLQNQLRSATWDANSGKPADQKVFSIPVALSIMVFFALCAQCVSTLAVIRRETNSWRWPIFTFVYMTGLAYLAAMLVYQVGSRWTM